MSACASCASRTSAVRSAGGHRALAAAALVCGAACADAGRGAGAERAGGPQRDVFGDGVDPALVAPGHAIFLDSCASCHGLDAGKGSPDADRACTAWERRRPTSISRPAGCRSPRRASSRLAPARLSRPSRSALWSPTSRRSAARRSRPSRRPPARSRRASSSSRSTVRAATRSRREAASSRARSCLR